MYRAIAFISIIFSIYIPNSFAQFAGGSGTEMDPWLIETAEQLSSVRGFLGENNQNKHFKLNNNIDLNTSPWNDGAGWNPIGFYIGENPHTIGSGNDPRAFWGKFDGAGYIINGLYINRPDQHGVGLFGSLYNGSVKNLGLTNVNIKGKKSVGGLIGTIYLSDKTTIEQCFVTGDVEGESGVGGFIGEVIEGSAIITNCYSKASVTGVNKVGGFFGSLYSGWVLNFIPVKNCYSLGSVSGNSQVGGFMGHTWAPKSTQCFWNKETSGQNTSAEGTGLTDQEAKNFITYLLADWDFKGYGTEGIWNINNERNDGYPFLSWEYPDDPTFVPSEEIAPIIKTTKINVSSSSTATGIAKVYYFGNPMATSHGFCYNTTRLPTIDDNTTDEGTLNTIGEFSTTITELQPVTYYFRAYATNSVGTSYGNVFEVTVPPIDPIVPEGAGTSDDPYKIANLNNLVWLQLNRPSNNDYFHQIADIDASQTVSWDGGKGWKPIYFVGHYYGNNHIINGIFINRPDEDNCGFFGYFARAVGQRANVFDLGLTNVNITGRRFVGGLIGIGTYGTVQNCYSWGSVNGESDVGGLIGYSWLTVENCFSNTVVTGKTYVGGLVGYRSSMYNNNLLNKSYSTGDVNGVECVGGLVGYGFGGVVDSYSTSNVSGNFYVGGLYGNLSSGTISNSYSTGEVIGMEFVGGLIGKSTGSVNNSFWNLQTSNQQDSEGGVGLNTIEMLNESSYSNWDFSEVWSIFESKSYPFLRNQSGPFEWNYPHGTIINPVLAVGIPHKGGITSGSGYYPQDVHITIEARQSEGFVFVHWEDIQGNVICTNPSYSFTMPNKEAVYFAHFAEITNEFELKGELQVCEQSKIVYTVVRDNSNIYKWIVKGGEIVSESYNSIEVLWKTEEKGAIYLAEYINSKWYISSLAEISISQFEPLISPTIRKKGTRNILICTTSNLNYHWYKDNVLIENHFDQYYVAEQNYGEYRVLIYDSNSCPNVSSAFELTYEKSNNLSIKVYPNPNKGRFKTEVKSEKDGLGVFSIYNSLGVLVFIKKIPIHQNGVEVNIDNLELDKGVYILNLKNEFGDSVNERVIVN